MILVLPVSETDNKLVDCFCSLLKKLGPYKKHKVLFVYKQADVDIVNKMKKHFKDLFSEEMDCIIDHRCPLGWPQGPNYFWRQTVFFLRGRRNELPWYWMELDVTPIKEGWLDLLEEQYLYFNKPFMGFVASDSNNYPRHLSGCAIYPPDISQYTNDWKWITNGCAMAFDIICGGQTRVLENTFFPKSMLNLFRTKNYKLNKDGLTYEHEYSRFEFGLDEDLREQFIDNNTLVVHGCKDGSLAELIKAL